VPTPVQLGRIRITERSVDEVVDRTALVSIPRAEVERAVIRHGTVAERPGVLIALGSIATTLGLLGVTSLFRGGLMMRTQSTLLIALVGGPLLIAAALRRGYRLDVETRRGVRRLGFGMAVDESQIAALVTAAQVEVGCTIELAS
jgi:hypothetical protein